MNTYEVETTKLTTVDTLRPENRRISTSYLALTTFIQMLYNVQLTINQDNVCNKLWLLVGWCRILPVFVCNLSNLKTDQAKNVFSEMHYRPIKWLLSSKLAILGEAGARLPLISQLSPIILLISLALPGTRTTRALSRHEKM